MAQGMKSRASKEFLELVKAIGECKSKAEEDAIVVREIESLKVRLIDSQVDRVKMKELLLRLLYVDMLGHDASFGYIQAVKMCNEPSLLLKKVGYMTTALFLDHSHELIILIVNTLQQDLRNDNHLIACAALTASAKLASAETIPALVQGVLDLLPHPKELVRKKAVLTLHAFFQRAPDCVAPHLPRFRQMLCDKDPSVMNAALCALHHIVASDPGPYKSLVPSFVNILKQVVEHRLPKTYNYHRVPAPFIQIKLMKILGYLGHSDRQYSEHMYAVLGEVLRRGDSHNTIGNALLYECVKTITTIYPNPKLLESAADITARFLRSSGHNLKYIGIDALGAVVRINSKYAVEHQMAVIDCLEDPDDTLKRKTMGLLYQMTKPGNVEVIVDKMVAFLKTTSDPHVKEDTVTKVISLAERYAPSNQWFVRTVNDVLETAGDLVKEVVAHNLMRLIAEGAGDEDADADHELRVSAVESYMELLKKPKLPEVLLKIICWVLGEYGLLCPNSSGPQLVTTLVDVVERQATASATLKAYVLSAITKVCAQAKIGVPADAEELVRACSTSRSVDLQQRSHELQTLLELPHDALVAVLPSDSSCDAMEVDPELSFLGSFVAEALANGHAPYVPPEERQGAFDLSALEGYAAGGGSAAAARPGHAASDHALRFQAYDNPMDSVPQMAQASGASKARSDASATELSDAFGALGRATTGSLGGGLRLNTGDGPKRWAPPPAPGASSAAPSSSNTPAPTPPTAAQHAAPAQAAPQRIVRAPEQPKAMTEKEKLAASLFGGMGGGSSANTASTTRPAHVAPTRASPKPSSAPAAPAPAPKSDMDLLLDLDSPSSAAPAADPFATLEGLSLADSAPAAPVPASSAPAGGFDLASLYSVPSPMQYATPMHHQTSIHMPPQMPMGQLGGNGIGLPGVMQPHQVGMGGAIPVNPGIHIQPAGLGSMSSAANNAPMNPNALPVASAKAPDPFQDLLG
mmetsp:Transcript_47898/g.89251  ORF Transcript_47898/g.89251 Transcript_47898/m.89251 type:complete len:978 (-) Transcript_47898:454-3387(-)|eukprot:CAMPEP_0114233098 /NCGR_PEP_ID=MMETSP0058-20121206/4973_1 /TAXON_ID=36894 /ORGANISM="Pyramimonas parkeae, CCMP726" /LENGTH=977 /DNA_ID=CAMNT_0001344645 /DNA_START=188 /DNA_END=3124 /DNA_ORIENTATION=+